MDTGLRMEINSWINQRSVHEKKKNILPAAILFQLSWDVDSHRLGRDKKGREKKKRDTVVFTEYAGTSLLVEIQ